MDLDTYLDVVYDFILEYDDFPKRESREEGHVSSTKDKRGNYAYNVYRDLLLLYTGNHYYFNERQVKRLEKLIELE